MENFLEIFKNKYHRALLMPAGNNPVRDRAAGFQKIFEIYGTLINPVVLETGTLRSDHGDLAFGDDGCSTIIWDDYVNNNNGVLISVDINPVNCSHAMKHVSERSKVCCSDSVKFISELSQDNPKLKFDIVYLDSYDVSIDTVHESSLHHLKELCAVMPMLWSGSLVIVDDSDAFLDGSGNGKAKYVRDFMQNINAELIHDGYQLIYRMP